MSEKSFIVPHDFTPVADIALEHAIATAKPLKAEVQLVHVVSKENQIHEANQKLDSIVEKYASSGVKIVANVRLGNIFEDIGDFALEHEAELLHASAPSVYVQTIAAIQVVTIFDMGLKNITLYLSYIVSDILCSSDVNGGLEEFKLTFSLRKQAEHSMQPSYKEPWW